MNTDLLRSFVEVARQESYTKAAKLLYISQPAVYQHVHALEQLLGADLVRLVGKRVLLTFEGKVVLDQAIRVLAETSELLNSVLLNEHSLRSGQLDIVVGTTFGQAVLPLAVGDFRACYPGIFIRAAVLHSTDDIDDNVLRLGYDGGFHSSERARTGLDKDPLIDDTLIGIVPKDHPLANRTSLSAADLAPYGMIWYAKPYELRRKIEAWASDQDTALPTSIELNSQTAMVTAVAAQAGVTIVSALSALPFIKAAEVRAIPLDPPLSRKWFFVHRTGATVPLALTRLTETLRAASMAAQTSITALVHTPWRAGPATTHTAQ